MFFRGEGVGKRDALSLPSAKPLSVGMWPMLALVALLTVHTWLLLAPVSINPDL